MSPDTAGTAEASTPLPRGGEGHEATPADGEKTPSGEITGDGRAPGPTVDRLPVGVYRTSPAGELVYANEALTRILAFPDIESLTGTDVRSLYVDPEARDRWAREMKQTGAVRHREAEIRRHDGSTTWVRHSSHVIRGADGEVLWFEGVMEDVGEIRALKRERKRKTRMLTLLEEVATAANCTSDPEEIFRLVLDRVCSFTGWPVGHVYLASEEAPTTLWPSDIWHVEDGDAFSRLMDVTAVTTFPAGTGLPGTVLVTGEAQWIPDVASDPDFLRARREPDLEARAGFACPVLIGDEVVAVLEFFSPEISEPDEEFLDLTVRVGAIVGRVVERARAARHLRRLHDELEDRVERRTAELEASVQELEGFTYGVSHDLRTPLRALDGFSKALLEDYGPQLDETGRDYLQRVRRASQRMGDLIDDLLGLSRISRRSLTPELVDLSSLARTVVEELSDIEPDRAVSVEIQPGIEVLADGSLLRIVLENLLGNAWKFTSEEEDARIEVRARTEKGEHVVQIRDNGAGFDPEYADKLFAPFQRLHRDDEFPGTGIGLATVRRIIRRHGGRVWAEGEPRVGATFSFALPERNGGPDRGKPDRSADGRRNR